MCKLGKVAPSERARVWDDDVCVQIEKNGGGIAYLPLPWHCEGIARQETRVSVPPFFPSLNCQRLPPAKQWCKNHGIKLSDSVQHSNEDGLAGYDRG
ncbi:Hypothetical predicted protein [Olea europaea subsp. europaea]|uniref:Uncharacterized protein n=1 Tax=Olea europaea subsp. europaea TaxID=158383 RepID=A0A8S0SR53_OLEEU|nr:Hypothetical predicted protein [Olea europaea subsp. europaea]